MSYSKPPPPIGLAGRAVNQGVRRSFEPVREVARHALAHPLTTYEHALAIEREIELKHNGVIDANHAALIEAAREAGLL